MSVGQVIRGFTVKPAKRAFTQITLLGSVSHVTVVHMELSAYCATVLGNASAKWVSLALHVTDAKMDIMALVRMAACRASAIIGLPVVMPSQVLV